MVMPMIRRVGLFLLRVLRCASRRYREMLPSISSWALRALMFASKAFLLIMRLVTSVVRSTSDGGRDSAPEFGRSNPV